MKKASEKKSKREGHLPLKLHAVFAAKRARLYEYHPVCTTKASACRTGIGRATTFERNSIAQQELLMPKWRGCL
jgi:hypothetical protein